MDDYNLEGPRRSNPTISQAARRNCESLALMKSWYSVISSAIMPEVGGRYARVDDDIDEVY
jgi:hypothetical protein